jgi:plasmid stability protein
MKKAHQYTIRNVPDALHRALTKKAGAHGVSLNALVLKALEGEAGLSAEVPERRDLDGFAGSWVRDAAVDKALAEFRKVDPKDWA